MSKAIMLAVALAMFSAFGGNWKNLDDEHYYSGPKLTEADLAGKVVLVDCWGVKCPPCRKLLPRMQELWQSFKNKPFVLVGSHCQGKQPDAVKELVEANGLTYPMYERFGLMEGEPEFRAIPFLYVVNHRGRLVYKGHDEREATEALVTAIASIGAPPSLCTGVVLSKFKGMRKNLVLGKFTKADRKKLETAAAGKNAAQTEEAKQILEAIENVRKEIKSEIDAVKKVNAIEAVGLIELYIKTWPEQGAEYKAELPALKTTAAAEKAKLEAAKAAAKSKK